MGLIVGSARIDENGNIANGKAGDQNNREVSTQNYYMHKKGWYVIRPKTIPLANGIASAMMQACNNAKIGYDQSNREDIITQLKNYGSIQKIQTLTECDCSSLVRACCIQNKVYPSNFTTANEASVLYRTGMFLQKRSVTKNTVLFNGDILVTKTKGHTVVIVSGFARYKKGDSNLNPPTANSGTSNYKIIQSSPSYVVGRVYTVRVNQLNVRTGPGTNYTRKTKAQLTNDGKKHANSAGQYMEGTRVTCKSVRKSGNDIWIKTPSGWVCAFYKGKVYIS